MIEEEGNCFYHIISMLNHTISSFSFSCSKLFCWLVIILYVFYFMLSFLLRKLNFKTTIFLRRVNSATHFICSSSAVPPNFVMSPINQTIPKGKTAIFSCQATGIPVPSIKWYKTLSPMMCASLFYQMERLWSKVYLNKTVVGSPAVQQMTQEQVKKEYTF